MGISDRELRKRLPQAGLVGRASRLPRIFEYFMSMERQSVVEQSLRFTQRLCG
jgi:hypothetical protein